MVAMVVVVVGARDLEATAEAVDQAHDEDVVGVAVVDVGAGVEVVAVVEDMGRVVEVEVVVAPVLALNPTRMARTPPFRNQRRTTQPQPMGGPRRMPE